MNAESTFRGPLAAAAANTLDTADARAWQRLLAHPATALPLAPADDRSVWEPLAGLVDGATARDMVARAEADVHFPWPQPTASAAARVHRDGDREEWERPAFARQHRLTRVAAAAAITSDPRWIDEVADGLLLVCEQSSWCWPAHDDAHERHGSVLASVSDPFLDLGAGEAVAQLAWIDQLLGTRLDDRYPGLRARLRFEATTRVFTPFVTRRDWHWIGLDGDVHNWSPWIHGNVVVAALRLLDADDVLDMRARVIALAVEGLDRYIAALPDDGAIDEGHEYWWNGACRALEALDVLAHATGGRFDPAPSVPALRSTVAFPHRMHLGGEWFASVADSQARPRADKPWHALHRAARRAGDDEACAFAASHRRPGEPVSNELEGAGRALRGMTDRDWIEAQPGQPPLPRDVWLPSVQLAVAREQAGSAAGLTLVAKGGHNDEHHNHNDVGAFVVAVDGVPVLVDPGRPTYTKQTFGPRRYDTWTMRSEAHNVPRVRGNGQRSGRRYTARSVAYEVMEDTVSLGMRIEDAYDVPALRRWRRTISLDRETSRPARISIHDEWDLEASDDGDGATTVRVLLAGEATVGRGVARVLPLDRAPCLIVRWPHDVSTRTRRHRLDDPLLTEVWGEALIVLELHVDDRSDLLLTVELDTERCMEER